MEERDEVPLYQKPIKVGIVYNLKKGIKSDVEDIEAEYDNISTVQAIQNALEKNGLETVLLEVDDKFIEKLKKAKVDIIFNIAEGINGRGREAQIPAIASMLSIPYTGSDETTLCICLDKALTKRILFTYHIKSPKSIVLSKDKKISASGLKFPLIIKPNAEGSSKGISDISIVKSKSELIKLVNANFNAYGQDMLAEEYIDGREFTVGVIGNGSDTYVFPPMEIKFKKPTQDNFSVYSFNVKKDYKKFIEYKCPSDIDKTAENKMIENAKKIYFALGCRDFARIDFRTDKNNQPYFIEINPLPGLAPNYSDFPMIAEFCTVKYDALIMKVLNCALKRYNILGKTKEDGDKL